MKSRTLLGAVVSWWRAAARAVKRPADGQDFPPAGWKRHVQGWQAALVMLAIVVVAALLVVPRPVIPSELPLPQTDREQQRRAEALDRERSRRAERTPLDFDVRAVGEALRRHGLAEAAARGDDDPGSTLGELRRATTLALRRHGVEPLLTLCAVQTDLFLRALDRWQQTRAVAPELHELGGSFPSKARAQGWLRGDGRLVLSAGERAILFRMRWIELTGLRKTRGFEPSLDEWRAYYRVFLEHDHGRPEEQLGVVAALSKIDPDYPAELARGILLLRLGDRSSAARALRAHLAGPRSDFWRLRARNALAAAMEP